MTARPEPDFKELETFIAVTDEGSFTAAARRLGTNQPTVSGRIASLETSLGVRLFDRGPRHTAPTPAGLALLSTARRILRGREELHRLVARFGDEPAGELWIAASTVPAGYVLPQALARLHASAPKVHSRVRVGDSRQTLAALRSGTAELAIVGRRPDDESLEAISIGRDAVVLVATPEFATAHGLTRSDASLSEVPLVLREEGSATRQTALEALARHGVTVTPEQVVLETTNNDALREAANAGLGAAFVSRLVVRRELEQGALIALDELAPPAEREFFLVTPRGRTLSRAAEALVDILRSS